MMEFYTTGNLVQNSLSKPLKVALVEAHQKYAYGWIKASNYLKTRQKQHNQGDVLSMFNYAMIVGKKAMFIFEL